MKAKNQRSKVKTGAGKGEPSTMEELLASTGYQPRGFKRGELVRGLVTEVTGRAVFVDIGGKTEAVVSDQEYDLFKDYIRALKVGDEVTAVVVVTESDAGQVVLSLRRAAADSKWKLVEEAMGDGRILSGKVKEATKGGLLVEIEGVIGFVPSSQVSAKYDGGAGLLGQQIQVKVIEVDREQNRLVLSEKIVGEAEEMEERRKILELVQVGGEYEGVVVGIVPFGAFVEIELKDKGGKGEGVVRLEGLVHISEISWEKVEDLAKFLKEGSRVKVQVIGVDEENGKLALSMKRLTGDPWLTVGKKNKQDSKCKGGVTKIGHYGVLANLEKGVEGLIHASKMPVNMSFSEGQEVEVFVESVDLEKRRLSLGVVLTEKPVGYK